MAKKRSAKKEVRFYEALATAPRLTRTAGSQVARDAGEVLNRIPWDRWQQEASAAIHDAWYWVREAARAVTEPRTRVVILSLMLIGMVGGSLAAVDLAVASMQKYGSLLRNPALIMNAKNTGTTIVDRHGRVLYQDYGAVSRHNIPLSEVPESLKQATLATEDPDFYHHAGFSWRGTLRAGYQDVLHNGKVQGGSTITQQLVKNTLLSSNKSFIRKYQEIVLSMELERRYSKDQILQMYLNTIYYGEGSYGIESAAETYFHKPAKDLTTNESALLAGLPQSPSTYDPNVNYGAAVQRRDYVLDRMSQFKYVTPAEAAQIKASPVVASTRQSTILAPHFVFYVLDQIRQQYGEDKIEHGGIVVHTTLDYQKQQQAQQMVKDQVDKLASHHVTNGGLVSMDPHNGDIISMVGSTDYYAPGFGNVNVTLSQLQPGSSFKPIAYSVAFQKGWNGSTVVQDKPISFPQGDGSTYSPKDYDNKWRGPVTLRRALSNSLNIPAIEVMQYAGLPDTIAMAHNLGIEPPSLTDQSRYGLSLVLGGGEVRPIDMAAVYSAFANQGRTVTPRAITSVDDKFGQDITKHTPNTDHQAVDPRVAYMLTNILSDTKARQEEFGQNNPLQLSRPAAAKTGTTNDFRDNWTVGYTPDVATAVWVGNNDHTPMQNVDGITGAAPIWHSYMEAATAGTPARDFAVPSGVVMAKVCQADGGLVDPNDPNGVNEVFLAEHQQTKKCGSVGIPGGQAPASPNRQPAPPPPQPATPVPEQAQAPSPTPTNVGSGGGDGGTGGSPGGSNGGGNPGQGGNPPGKP